MFSRIVFDFQNPVSRFSFGVSQFVPLWERLVINELD
jgi:hypothetical protein